MVLLSLNDSTVQQTGAQWINCDIRTFNLEKLGKFSVIMADPPWDIHMDVCSVH